MTKAGEASLIERLTLCAEDPMWADHAEISKRTLRETIMALHFAERSATVNDEALRSSSLMFEEAERALEPFARQADHITKSHPEWDHDGYLLSVGTTLGPYRAARTLLTSLKGRNK